MIGYACFAYQSAVSPIMHLDERMRPVVNRLAYRCGSCSGRDESGPYAPAGAGWFAPAARGPTAPVSFVKVHNRLLLDLNQAGDTSDSWCNAIPVATRRIPAISSSVGIWCRTKIPIMVADAGSKESKRANVARGKRAIAS